ncbi:ParB N-terminal domain-containing protein [Maridesulfovibrio ferrireducens]|uniref:ParB N-terminal domain-containing protein n=1 Tax=Maridesulfovibrio ferrireducens TaxID=246191 RepID=UPI001A1E19F7|nr:ParB N-terminal domain-containing protein [Maridesulfovibrio ferrireducens]MBI9113235.1 ParB N-terminal domain-containing protein [Maridesulfovibrio ferrireducens]
MVQANEDWYDKRITLTVDNLRLWPNNPRFDETDLETTRDFAKCISESKIDKSSFFNLIQSIIQNGFVNIEPIVVFKYKNNDKYYVAEGNRRVLALKLLRNPKFAPKSIRSYISAASKKINRDSIKKIKVIVSPSLSDAQWYIGQRNNISTIKQSWTKLQQCRWVAELAKDVNNDLNLIRKTAQLSTSEILRVLRINAFNKLINTELMQEVLSHEEISIMQSRNFPVSIIERFYDSSIVQDRWGIKFDGPNIRIYNFVDFIISYAELLRRVISKNNELIKIDTRTITTHIEEILDSLPSIDLSIKNSQYTLNIFEDIVFGDEIIETFEETIEEEEQTNEQKFSKNEHVHKESKRSPLLNNTKRNRLVPENVTVNTGNARIQDLFNELKGCPIQGRENIIAISLRVLFELVVLDYLIRENLDSGLLSKHNKTDLSYIGLKDRLVYIRTLKKKNKKVTKIINGLLRPENDYSIDTLNIYMHSEQTYAITRERLVCFFDYLFPLLQEFLVLTVHR